MICLGIAIALTGLLPAARSFTFSGRPTGQTKGFEMEQWEYWTGFIWANAEDKDVKEFLKNRFPNWSPPKYAPQAMMPELNTFGEQGWELVHMEPVVVGKNYDVGFSYGGSGGTSWTNIYFCVCKRVKQ